jgi:hypothetical protein
VFSGAELPYPRREHQIMAVISLTDAEQLEFRCSTTTRVRPRATQQISNKYSTKTGRGTTVSILEKFSPRGDMTWHWAVSLEHTHGREGCSRAHSLAPLPAYPTNAASGSLFIHTLLSFLLEERCARGGKRAGGILRFGRGLWANAQGCPGSKYMHFILENGSTNGREL